MAVSNLGEIGLLRAGCSTASADGVEAALEGKRGFFFGGILCVDNESKECSTFKLHLTYSLFTLGRVRLESEYCRTSTPVQSRRLGKAAYELKLDSRDLSPDILCKIARGRHASLCTPASFEFFGVKLDTGFVIASTSSHPSV